MFLCLFLLLPNSLYFSWVFFLVCATDGGLFAQQGPWDMGSVYPVGQGGEFLVLNDHHGQMTGCRK